MKKQPASTASVLVRLFLRRLCGFLAQLFEPVVKEGDQKHRRQKRQSGEEQVAVASLAGFDHQDRDRDSGQFKQDDFGQFQWNAPTKVVIRFCGSNDISPPLML